MFRYLFKLHFHIQQTDSQCDLSTFALHGQIRDNEREDETEDGDGYGDNKEDPFPRDYDNDGHTDIEFGGEDSFPTDSAASIDSDGDGYPDGWNKKPNYYNEYYTETDSTTGLRLDKFPSDPACSLDTDNDHYPDEWNSGCTQSDSTTGIKYIDDFPYDPVRALDSDNDGFADILLGTSFENDNWCPDIWETGGDIPWKITNDCSHNGSYSITSGETSTDGTSYIEATLEYESAGYILFWLKILYTDSGYYRYSDSLIFSIDGAATVGYESSTDWTPIFVFIDSGFHTFRWKFYTETTSDQVWVDDIIFNGIDEESEIDVEDAFPLDPSASVDMDSDGYPDEWNEAKGEKDSTTGLRLDAFPNDPAASLDDDIDGFPDEWNEGKTEMNSILGLSLDYFPSDPKKHLKDTDYDGHPDKNDVFPNNRHEWADSDWFWGDGIGDNADWLPWLPNTLFYILLIIILIILCCIGFLFYKRRKERNENSKPLGLLGSGGSGKTVFFGMLGKVLGMGQYSSLSIEYDEGLGYLREVVKTLELGEWPATTFVGTKKRFTARIYEKMLFSTRVHRIIVNDIAGEDFEKAFDPDKEGEKIPEHFNHIPDSTALIWIIDPTRVTSDKWHYYQLMRCLLKMKNIGSTGKLKMPIAIVFSKADKYANQIGNVHRFGREKFGELYSLLERRVKHFRFFTVAAVATETKDGKPRLPLAPRGIGEVIEWVLTYANTSVRGGLRKKGKEPEVDEFAGLGLPPDQSPGTDQFGQPEQPGMDQFGQPEQPGMDQFGQPPQQPGMDQFGQPQQQPGMDQFGQPAQPQLGFGQPPAPMGGGNTCPHCHSPIEPGWFLCPNCHSQL